MKTSHDRLDAGRLGRPTYGAMEEFEFFEKVKKTISNKTTYTEFLKVLNLFNQDIIDPKILVERVEPFLAKTPELFDWFKLYVKYEEKDYHIGKDSGVPSCR
jgi:histone deacetylase complex regulatory component SIN3